MMNLSFDERHQSINLFWGNHLPSSDTQQVYNKLNLIYNTMNAFLLTVSEAAGFSTTDSSFEA